MIELLKDLINYSWETFCNFYENIFFITDISSSDQDKVSIGIEVDGILNLVVKPISASDIHVEMADMPLDDDSKKKIVEKNLEKMDYLLTEKQYFELIDFVKKLKMENKSRHYVRIMVIGALKQLELTNSECYKILKIMSKSLTKSQFELYIKQITVWEKELEQENNSKVENLSYNESSYDDQFEDADEDEDIDNRRFYIFDGIKYYCNDDDNDVHIKILNDFDSNEQLNLLEDKEMNIDDDIRRTRYPSKYDKYLKRK